MGNCASAKGPEAGVGVRLAGDNTSVVSDLPSFKPPRQSLGGQGSAAILDICSRDGVQLLLSHTSSMPSASNSSSSSSVGKHCPSSPTNSGTPRCSSSISSNCKPLVEAHEKGFLDQASSPRPFLSPSCYQREASPLDPLHDGENKQPFTSKQPSPSSPAFPSPLSRPHRFSLPSNFRQASKTFSHGSPHHKTLPTNFRQASKTFTHGSLLPNFASHSQTPSSTASMAQWTSLESRATVSSTDAASLTWIEEPQDHLGFPGSGRDLKGYMSMGDRPPSVGRAPCSPCPMEAPSAGFQQSNPFAQQWPAVGKTGSQNLSEDAACLHDAAPASPEDWRSVHMAMAVAAEQGEHVPLPSEDNDTERVGRCTSSPMSSTAKEEAHTAAKPCLHSLRHSVPYYGPDQGSFRPSPTSSACITPGSRDSQCSSNSSSKRRSPVSNTSARLSNVFSRPFMDGHKTRQ